MPDAFIHYMSLPTIQKYMNCLQGPGVKSYRIQYKDIFKALDRLLIKDSCYLLSAGVYLGNYEAMYGRVEGYDNIHTTYKDIFIHSIDSQMLSIFVIPKECLPFVEYTSISPATNMRPLDESNTLYSNIDDISVPGFNQSLFFLTLARGVKMTWLKDGFRCIKLDVTHDSSEGDLDLNNVNW